MVLVITAALSIWHFSTIGQNREDPYLHIGSKHVPLEAIQLFSKHGINLELTNEENESVTPLDKFFIMGSMIPQDTEKLARNPNEYKLMITGAVEENVSLSYEELLERFEMKQTVTTLFCMPNLRGIGKFVGPSMYDVISYARPDSEATKVIVVAADGYEHEFTLEEIREHRDNWILAMAMNGYPLATEHGYPVRLALTLEPGTSWVKWVVRIIVVV